MVVRNRVSGMERVNGFRGGRGGGGVEKYFTWLLLVLDNDSHGLIQLHFLLNTHAYTETARFVDASAITIALHQTQISL